ncbi:hypothetical protein BDW59DRAFT_159928 [Aspergillus cavernicola]|uniref:Uncharacterized protein n=1 Tax=Aspergillus cavernicola TaxID=176166 RepID=A0ABR4IJP6_9EURO
MHLTTTLLPLHTLSLSLATALPAAKRGLPCPYDNYSQCIQVEGNLCIAMCLGESPRNHNTCLTGCPGQIGGICGGMYEC